MNMNDMTKKLYPVTGMHCAACAGNVEKIVRKQEGVENASVNLATATLAYGLVHKMPTRKKHFISSDCLISKGDIRLWQKDLLEKKEKNGTIVSIKNFHLYRFFG